MVGLPPGAGLDVSIWGRKGHALGELELIEYQGVEGSDLYPRAVPKARGILQLTYRVDRLAEIVARLEAHGIDFERRESVSTLAGQGALLRFSSPAGLRIDVMAD